MKTRFCSIGSINVDLVVQVDRFPRPGETRSGTNFGTYPGGKGANQAVALARLGAEVLMAGKVGDDAFGELCKNNFNAVGVRTDELEVVDGESTGVALIEINQVGENHIVIVAGANGKLDTAYIDRHMQTLSGVGFALFQLETPFAPTTYAMEQLTKSGVMTILDPAPAPSEGLDSDLLRHVAILTPNESETETLTGIPVTSTESAGAAGAVLREKGAQVVVIKSGAEGAYLVEDDGVQHVPGFSVTATDTTAAGDAFNAGLAYALGHHFSLYEAVRYGNAVGAMACTGLGAQSAMPSREQAESLITGCGT